MHDIKVVIVNSPINYIQSVILSVFVNTDNIIDCVRSLL